MIKDNAFDLYPRLKKEFDSIKNSNITYITTGSSKKYWFNCSLCNKQYFNSVKNWIRVDGNKSKICKHVAYKSRSSKIIKNIVEFNNDLLSEWDFELNLDSPYNINYGSEKLAYWKCSKCLSSYKTKICKRTTDKSNCPYCDGKKVNSTNSLYSLNLNVAKKLKNINLAKTVTIKSGKKLEWVCEKCNEYFISPVYLIINLNNKGNSGCPFCSGKKVNYKNNLLATHPEIAAEWNYDKNNSKPEQYTAGSGSRFKVWWKCKSNHEWKAGINRRTGTINGSGSGCPFCCHKISLPEIAWLNSLNIPTIERQKSIVINGKRFKPDGYDPLTNTIYEFYGDYYHGNPKIYNLNDKNCTCKKTFGQLYDNTINKEKILINNGYKLITIWESDWNKLLI